MKLKLIKPSVGNHSDYGSYSDYRSGFELSFPTKFVRIKTNGDLPNYLELAVLGFGLSFTWR